MNLTVDVSNKPIDETGAFLGNTRFPQTLGQKKRARIEETGLNLNKKQIVEREGQIHAVAVSSNRQLFGTSNPNKIKTINNPTSRKFSRITTNKNTKWTIKSPDIDWDSNICINGIKYPIEKVGEGRYCFVYRFTNLAQLNINNELLSTDQIVLKRTNPQNIGGKQREAVHLTMKKAYEYLRHENIPVATVYVDPLTFQDTHNEKNGGFWLVEKCINPINGEGWKGKKHFDELSTNDQTILKWVKHFFSITANNNVEIINDLFLRNVMIDKDLQVKIVDYSLPEAEESNIIPNLKMYVKDWACENENIFNFLIENFPQDVKNEMKE